MAKKKPNRQSNTSNADGERWISEENSVRRADRNSGTDRGSPDDGGGISNRPLDEEIMKNEDGDVDR